MHGSQLTDCRRPQPCRRPNKMAATTRTNLQTHCIRQIAVGPRDGAVRRSCPASTDGKQSATWRRSIVVAGIRCGIDCCLEEENSASISVEDNLDDVSLYPEYDDVKYSPNMNSLDCKCIRLPEAYSLVTLRLPAPDRLWSGMFIYIQCSRTLHGSLFIALWVAPD